ncbi:MAG: hypothetical protein KDC75_03805 [Phaeodactylibacter sp.]|nr:hypothetical protein [Phaeodactylibacter sp.]
MLRINCFSNVLEWMVLLLFFSFGIDSYGQQPKVKVMLIDRTELDAYDVRISAKENLLFLSYQEAAGSVRSVKLPLQKVSYIIFSDGTLDLFFENGLPPEGPMPLGLPYSSFFLRKIPLSSEMYAFDGEIFHQGDIKARASRHPETTEIFSKEKVSRRVGNTLIIAGVSGVVASGALAFHEESKTWSDYQKSREGAHFVPSIILGAASLAVIVVGANFKMHRALEPYRMARLYNREVYQQCRARLKVAPVRPSGPGISLLMQF